MWSHQRGRILCVARASIIWAMNFARLTYAVETLLSAPARAIRTARRADITGSGKFAVAAGTMAANASRALGKGSGGMIGGRVAARLSPDLLTQLAQNKTVVIVTGTNGKSTTTRMIAEIFAAAGNKVASNRGGDNMESGVLAALMAAPDATHVVLEVDEMWVQKVAAQCHPAAFVFLNLSRDQLDRVGEIATIEKRLRETIAEHPRAFAVANVDDPLVTSAAWDSENPVWIAGGRGWANDSLTAPRTGGVIVYSQQPENSVAVSAAQNSGVPPQSGSDTTVWWRSTNIKNTAESHDFARPVPHWSWTAESESYLPGSAMTVHGPNLNATVTINLPGRANRSNATQAFAAAVSLGVDPQTAAEGIANVTAVAGRYAQMEIAAHQVRFLLAKNPAGWQEALTMLTPDASVVVGVNGQIPDGVDLSWLWDVDFSGLRGRTLWACGERGTDLYVRLHYADLPAQFADDPLTALAQIPPGPVDMLLNYTSFRDTTAQLRKMGYQL